ncbi:Dolichyl-phosphate-mannose-protein mannosyltransferase family protein [Coxiella burnetii str. Namibia]|nr:Dolichyl-phosphate-mannose-protein mannosyltransferase family protein [Coxiella burnetii str. Namibia]EDR36639.1 putative membrane protein [Coxiella burnetii Q321]PHH58010.1 hypothetical protein CRH12_01930 [Coxiella burnetii]
MIGQKLTNLQGEAKYQWSVLISIFCASLIFKLVVFFAFYRGDVHQLLQPDSGTYLEPAMALLKQGNYGHIFIRTPGYPTFIAAFFYLFGHNLSAIIIAQLILSIIPIFCGYLITRRLFNGRAGLITAVFLAVDYLFFSYAYFVLTDYLYAVTLSLVFLFGVWVLTESNPKYRHAFLLGLFFAIATLIRPVNYYLLFPSVAGLFIYLRFQKLRFKKIFLITLLMLLPNVLLVGGWQIRNKIAKGTFQYSGITTPANVKNYFPQNYALYVEKYGDPQSHYLKANFKIITDHPSLALKQMGIGFAKLMLGSNPILVDFFCRPENIKFYWKMQGKIQQLFWRGDFRQGIDELLSHPAAMTVFLYKIGLVFLNLMLYVLFIIGVRALYIRNLLKPKLFAHLFLAGSALYFILLCSNNASYARFRLPFQLLIDFYASVGWVAVWVKIKKLSFYPTKRIDSSITCVNYDK